MRRRSFHALLIVLVAQIVVGLGHMGAYHSLWDLIGDGLVWRTLAAFTELFDWPAYFFDWHFGVGFSFAYEDLTLGHWIADYSVFLVITTVTWFGLVLVITTTASAIRTWVKRGPKGV